jgi:hypothetical protein
MIYVKGELARGLGDWEQRLNTALVRTTPADIVRQATAGGQGPDAPGPAAREEERKGR